MNSKKVVSCACWVVMMVCAAFLVGNATDVADEFQVNSALFPKHTRPLVKFTHYEHMDTHGIDCGECHHRYENGKNVWQDGDEVQKCQTCHSDATQSGENKLPPDKQKLNLKLAFHNNCIACHKTSKSEDQASKAPLSCNQCHAKTGTAEGGGEATGGGQVMELASALYKEPLRGPVAFSHDTHAEKYRVACKECHHTFKDGKNVWEEGDEVNSCESCHNEPAQRGEIRFPASKRTLNLKWAFHQNCIGCHKKYTKMREDTTAPITCSKCHLKRK